MFWSRRRGMGALQSEESEMGSGEKCLRTLVGKWFGPSAVVKIRVVEFSRTRADRRRYVRIGGQRADGGLTIVFFRHDDGSWNVFPAKTSRPAMHAYQLAA
jgi:hypothetical protein